MQHIRTMLKTTGRAAVVVPDNMLPEPDDLAEEIIDNLEAGLNSFRDVLAGLGKQADAP